MKLILLISLTLFSWTAFSSSQKLLGTSRLTWYLFKVYDAKLYGLDRNRLMDQPLTLELTYLRDFKGKDIVAQSVKELRNLKVIESKIAQWTPVMRKIFPDIKEGDRIRAIYNPDNGISFYLNEKTELGSETDPEFSKNFIGIWLSPNTSEGEMRRELFGFKDE